MSDTPEAIAKRRRNAQRQKEYAARYPERIKGQQKKWREDNPQYHTLWREKNREKVKAQARARRRVLVSSAEGRAKVNKMWRAWADKQPPEFFKKRSDRVQEWKKNNRERMHFNNELRRQRKKCLVADLTLEQWLEILEENNHACFYCGATGEKLYKEHKIPVVRGGGYTKSNIVPACRRCNVRKHTKTSEEFMKL